MFVATSRSAEEPLRLVEMASWPLAPDEIRVGVRAIGVNPVDWKMRSGGPLRFAHRFVGPRGPLVVGVDFAGEVIETGAAVTDLAVGDRVVGGTDFSRKQRGSYATEVIVQPDQCARLPDKVSFEDAACLPVAAVTADRCLTELAGIKPGTKSRVLVLGASGGVGLFSLQLARNLSASVVGVCSTRNVSLVTQYGATAIDYTKGDALSMAEEMGPYDAVVNCVGTTLYDGARCRALLSRHGTHVLAVLSQGDALPLLFAMQTKAVLGRPDGAHLAPLVEALANARLETLIEERFSLADAEKAHVRSQAGKVVGKLLLLP